MSIILDALKKAEKDRRQSEEEIPLAPSPEPKLPRDSSLTKALIVLLLGLSIVGGLSLFAYKKISQKTPISQNIKPRAASSKHQNKPPAIDGAVEKAIAYLQNGEVEESLKQWQWIVSKDDHNAKAQNNLGYIAKKIGQRDLAYQSYTKALELDPDYPEALNNLGVLLLENSDIEKAKLNFEKAIRLNPNYAAPYFHLAITLEKSGDIQGAIDQFENFMKFSTDLDSEVKNRIEMKIALMRANL